MNFKQNHIYNQWFYFACVRIFERILHKDILIAFINL